MFSYFFGGSGGGSGGGSDVDGDDSPGSGVGYTVAPGDTLYGIAREQLGDGSRYVEIFEINRGRPQTVGGTLSDPGVLRVGWVFELPASDRTAPLASGETRAYTVEPGDSLTSIARDELGDPGRYQEIFELNDGIPQADGSALSDPSLLRVGWVLQLPAA
ncbi:MAG: LysM peptidoglycan-binding domain-containing protein [Cyanobacteriota bacterium]|nr:LysM peptidoglycan-binding domain-containing protein [Cyanobacteriota bacterium]